MTDRTPAGVSIAGPTTTATAPAGHQPAESPVDRAHRELREREAASNRAIFTEVTGSNEPEST